VCARCCDLIGVASALYSAGIGPPVTRGMCSIARRLVAIGTQSRSRARSNMSARRRHRARQSHINCSALAIGRSTCMYTHTIYRYNPRYIILVDCTKITSRIMKVRIARDFRDVCVLLPTTIMSMLAQLAVKQLLCWDDRFVSSRCC
jgi:hypothetical protein